MNDDELRPGQLRDLLPQPELPPALRERVMRSYATRPAGGAIRPRPAIRTALAAAAIFFAVGFATGRAQMKASTTASPVGGSSYALLLYDGARPDSAPDDVAEHIQWARELAASGRQISGEKLGNESVVLPANAEPGPTPLRGFFIVSARDAREAETIARSIPHFRNGGRVVVRPIDPT